MQTQCHSPFSNPEADITMKVHMIVSIHISFVSSHLLALGPRHIVRSGKLFTLSGTLALIVPEKPALSTQVSSHF